MTDPAIDATTYDSVGKLAAALEAKKPSGAAYTISGWNSPRVNLADMSPAFEDALNTNVATVMFFQLRRSAQLATHYGAERHFTARCS